MPISINGSGTITGISAGGLPDGSVTVDDIANGAVTPAKLSTGAPTWDSSSRLLVGTSSTTADSKLQVQGNVSNSAGTGDIQLRRGSSTPANGTGLGNINFADNNGYIGASINATTDAAWSASSYATRLVLSTCPDNSASPVERVRINWAGAGFWYSTGPSVLGLHSSKAAGTTDYLMVGTSAATGIDTGSTRLQIFTNGNILNTNNSYGQISDIKLKENIADAASQWDDIKAIQVKNFNFIGDATRQIGVIAQEIEQVSPGLIDEVPDRDEEGNDLGTVTKSVKYSVLYMKAVKALQEAMERIEQLEARLTAAGIE